MANVYFGWKLFIEVLPVIIWLILFAIVLIVSIVRSAVESQKINYLKSIGFERHLRNVASVGNKCWYSWRQDINETYIQSIKEEDLKHISLAKLKEKYPH